MKTRIGMTVMTLVVYLCGLKLFDLIYSPMAGRLTAAQVNDSNFDFFLAKFVSEGNLQKILSALTLLILVLTWVGFKKKTQNEK